MSLPANGSCLRVILAVFQLRLLFNLYSYVQSLTLFFFSDPVEQRKGESAGDGAGAGGGTGWRQPGVWSGGLGEGMAQRRPSLRRGAQEAGARSAGGRRERVHLLAGARPGRAARARGRTARARGAGARGTGRPVGPGPPPGRQEGGGLAMAPAWWGAGQGMGRRWRRPHSCGRGSELGRRRPHSGWAAPPRALGSAMAWVGGGFGVGMGKGGEEERACAGRGGGPGVEGGVGTGPSPATVSHGRRLFVIKDLRRKHVLQYRFAGQHCGSNRSLLLIFTSLLPITATFLLPLLPVVHHYYVKTGPLLLIITAVFTSFLLIITSVITSLLPVVPVIMNPLLQ